MFPIISYGLSCTTNRETQVIVAGTFPCQFYKNRFQASDFIPIALCRGWLDMQSHQMMRRPASRPDLQQELGAPDATGL